MREISCAAQGKSRPFPPFGRTINFSRRLEAELCCTPAIQRGVDGSSAATPASAPGPPSWNKFAVEHREVLTHSAGPPRKRVGLLLKMGKGRPIGCSVGSRSALASETLFAPKKFWFSKENKEMQQGACARSRLCGRLARRLQLSASDSRGCTRCRSVEGRESYGRFALYMGPRSYSWVHLADYVSVSTTSLLPRHGGCQTGASAGGLRASTIQFRYHVFLVWALFLWLRQVFAGNFISPGILSRAAPLRRPARYVQRQQYAGNCCGNGADGDSCLSGLNLMSSSKSGRRNAFRPGRKARARPQVEVTGNAVPMVLPISGPGWQNSAPTKPEIDRRVPGWKERRDRSRHHRPRFQRRTSLTGTR